MAEFRFGYHLDNMAQGRIQAPGCSPAPGYEYNYAARKWVNTGLNPLERRVAAASRLEHLKATLDCINNSGTRFSEHIAYRFKQPVPTKVFSKIEIRSRILVGV